MAPDFIDLTGRVVVRGAGGTGPEARNLNAELCSYRHA